MRTFGHTRQHLLDERGDRVEHVLAVVEQQHQLGGAEHVGDASRAAACRAGRRRRARRRRRRARCRRSAVASSQSTTGRSGSARRAAGGRPRAAAGSCRRRRARRASPDDPAATAATQLGGQLVAPDQRRRRDRQPVDGRRRRRRARRAASACWVTSAGDGSMPSSVARVRRKSSYTRSASARRPLAANAAINSWRGRSRNGCSSASAVRSATTPSASPRASPISASHLPGARPQLVDAGHLGPGLVDVGELGVRRPAPARRASAGAAYGPGGDGRREPVEVDVDGGRVEAVAVVDRVDRQRRHGPAQAGHVVLQCGRRIGRPRSPATGRRRPSRPRPPGRGAARAAPAADAAARPAA